MQKKTIIEIIYITMIIMVIVTCVIVGYWLVTDSKNCMENPLNYYMDKNDNAICYCIDPYNYVPE